MDDIEQAKYDECLNGIRVMLESFEKVYGTERLYWVIERFVKTELRPRHLAILMAEERENVL